MKKIIGLVILLTVGLIINQCYYFSNLQFKCADKINHNIKLNTYETLSAMQTHSMLWLIGWIVDPSTALVCFHKQFFIYNPFINPVISNENDPVIKEAKHKLLSNKTDEIRLSWKDYSSRNSILLNGSTIQTYKDETGDYFLYTIPSDYKPGIISICGITIVETVFDYLENNGLLGNPIYYIFERR